MVQRFDDVSPEVQQSILSLALYAVAMQSAQYKLAVLWALISTDRTPRLAARKLSHRSRTHPRLHQTLASPRSAVRNSS